MLRQSLRETVSLDVEGMAHMVGWKLRKDSAVVRVPWPMAR
jgi:hypothetical protein